MFHYICFLFPLLLLRVYAGTHCSAAIELNGTILLLRPVTVSSNDIDQPLFEVVDPQASAVTLLPDNLETIRAQRTYRYETSGAIVVNSATFRVTAFPPVTCPYTIAAMETTSAVSTPATSFQDGPGQCPAVTAVQGPETNDNISSRTTDTTHQLGRWQISTSLLSSTHISSLISGWIVSDLSSDSVVGTTSSKTYSVSTAVSSTSASRIVVTESDQPLLRSPSTSMSRDLIPSSTAFDTETGVRSTSIATDSAPSLNSSDGTSTLVSPLATLSSSRGVDLGRPIASTIGITSQQFSTSTSTSEASRSSRPNTLASSKTPLIGVSSSDLSRSTTVQQHASSSSSGFLLMPTSFGFLTSTSTPSAMTGSSSWNMITGTIESTPTSTSSSFRILESTTSTDVHPTSQTSTQKEDSITLTVSRSNTLLTVSRSDRTTQPEMDRSSDSDSVVATASIGRLRESMVSDGPDPSPTTVDIGLGLTTAIPGIIPTVVPDRPSTVPSASPPPTASNPGPPPVISSPPSPSPDQSTISVITSASDCETRTGSSCTQVCSFATDRTGVTTSTSCAQPSCLPSIGCSATVTTVTRTTDPACSVAPESEGLFATDGDGPLPTLLHTAQVVIRAPGEPSTSTTTPIGFTLISTIPAPQPTASLLPSQKFTYVDSIKNCTTSSGESRCSYTWSAMEGTPGARGGEKLDRCTDRSIWYGNSTTTVPTYPVDVGPFDLPSYKSCSIRKESESDGGTILCGSTATTCNYIRGNAKVDCAGSSQELSGNSVCIFVDL